MAEETMTAVVAYGPEDYRVERVPRPSPGPGEVLVQVGAIGICGTDVNCFAGASYFWGQDGVGGYCEPPVIPGHEFAGVVAQLGEGAAAKHGVSVGDSVVAEQIIPCERCHFCRNGFYWMCEPHEIFGFKTGRAEGGMAEYAVFPAKARVHPVDKRLSAVEAGYLEPLACAVRAVERAGIRPGDSVVVAGVGSIGLCMTQIARMYNPFQVIAVGTRPLRLDLARRLGADVVLNVRAEDAVAAVKDLTGGHGSDVTIEASGGREGPRQAMEMTRRMGTLVAFSTIKEPVLVNWSLAGQKELTIRGSHLGPYCYPKAIQWVAEGSVDVQSLVTAQFSLEQFDQAMASAMSGEGIKTMIVPGLPSTP